VLAAEKLKFAELSIPLFLVVFGNNFGWGANKEAETVREKG
jgi:hypothetical protein